MAFLGAPRDALIVALTIRENTTIPVRMSVNLCPVRLVRDINGQANIIGDGINVAQRASARRLNLTGSVQNRPVPPGSRPG